MVGAGTSYGRRNDLLRVCVLVEARYRRQTQPSGVARTLRERGHEVVLVDPASSAVDLADGTWCGDLDLLVGRGRSPAALALLAVAEARGVRVDRPGAPVPEGDRLDLFGVDCAVQPDGPVVPEVNDFPDRTGVGGADGCLAEYVIDQGRK